MIGRGRVHASAAAVVGLAGAGAIVFFVRSHGAGGPPGGVSPQDAIAARTVASLPNPEQVARVEATRPEREPSTPEVSDGDAGSSQEEAIRSLLADVGIDIELTDDELERLRHRVAHRRANRQRRLERALAAEGARSVADYQTECKEIYIAAKYEEVERLLDAGDFRVTKHFDFGRLPDGLDMIVFESCIQRDGARYNVFFPIRLARCQTVRVARENYFGARKMRLEDSIRAFNALDRAARQDWYVEYRAAVAEMKALLRNHSGSVPGAEMMRLQQKMPPPGAVIDAETLLLRPR